MTRRRVVVIGAGFSGLAAAYELCLNGVEVCVLEAEKEAGGLASTFDVGGNKLERFYHHWFTSDVVIQQLAEELGTSDRVVLRPTQTGMYYARTLHRLSTPLDLLRFKPLRFLDRLRLGKLVLAARRIKNWEALEHLTVEEWVVQVAGREVYRVAWEPLLRAKFGPHAPEVSAVGLWSKLKLRGGSRQGDGREQLAYYRGGFGALAEALVDRIKPHMWMCNQKTLDHFVCLFWLVRAYAVH